MEQTRRSVLRSAALAGTAFLMPLGVLEAFQEASARVDGDDGRIGMSRRRVSRSLLRGHVGSDFVVQTDDGARVALRLVEVEDVPNAAAANQEGSEDTFAARFEDSSSGVLLSQGTYVLRHDALGRREWFLVPVGMPSAEKQTYEAIFNKAPRNAGTPPRRLRHSR